MPIDDRDRNERCSRYRSIKPSVWGPASFMGREETRHEVPSCISLVGGRFETERPNRKAPGEGCSSSLLGKDIRRDLSCSTRATLHRWLKQDSQGSGLRQLTFVGASPLPDIVALSTNSRTSASPVCCSRALSLVSGSLRETSRSHPCPQAHPLSGG